MTKYVIIFFFFFEMVHSFPVKMSGFREPLIRHRHPFRSRETRLFDAAERIEEVEKTMEKLAEEELVQHHRTTNFTTTEKKKEEEEEEEHDPMENESSSYEESMRKEEEVVEGLRSLDTSSSDTDGSTTKGGYLRHKEDESSSSSSELIRSILGEEMREIEEELPNDMNLLQNQGVVDEDASVSNLFRPPSEILGQDKERMWIMIDRSAKACDEGQAWLHLLKDDDQCTYHMPCPPEGDQPHTYVLMKSIDESLETSLTWSYGCIDVPTTGFDDIRSFDVSRESVKGCEKMKDIDCTA